MATIIAKNVTASGISIPDLSGIYIDGNSEVELSTYFNLSRIENSSDLDNWISDGVIIINDGTKDLTQEESLEHTYIDTDYEVPKRFLQLLDTPNTYSGINYVFLKVKDTQDGIDFTPINFSDLDDIPTLSGNAGALTVVKDDETGVEFVYPQTTPFSVNVQDEGTNIDDTPHQTLDFVGNGVSVEDAGGQVAIINVAGSGDSGYFGFSFDETSDETMSYTTSTSYIQKLRLSLTGLDEGKYRIGWSFEWAGNNSNHRAEFRVQLDDTTDLSNVSVRPSEGSRDAWHPAAGFKYEDLASGDHYIDIDYKSTHHTKVAAIRKARLEFWRIS